MENCADEQYFQLLGYPADKSDIIQVYWTYQDRRLNKAMAKHFFDTKSTVENMVFVPFKRLKLGNSLILKLFENKAINVLNLIEAGVNR